MCLNTGGAYRGGQEGTLGGQSMTLRPKPAIKPGAPAARTKIPRRGRAAAKR
ncbi:hypothetical protein [Methanothrix sp.]